MEEKMMTAHAAVRVLVADDHPVVRAGIVSAIASQSDLRVVGEAGTGEEVVRLFRELRPDVTLVDLNMPGQGGISAIEAIRKEAPRARIIVLTVCDGDEDIRRALDAGAQGYLLKDVTAEKLLAAVRSVHAGFREVSEAVQSRLAEPPAELTDRELEVLQLIAKGFTNKETGKLLGVSEGTIKTHVVHILAKLEASDRTEAVMVAMQRGILHQS
ncbi:MAG: response regulator transcription factor [Acidobacteriota bacterium]